MYKCVIKHSFKGSPNGYDLKIFNKGETHEIPEYLYSRIKNDGSVELYDEGKPEENKPESPKKRRSKK